ncbi:Conserved oligomeric Golgi complex subunit 6 [Cryptosporidium felis]|nr:Conserved oligomeric Golgi complex subunit 6 [Cryptosporidium felis]
MEEKKSTTENAAANHPLKKKLSRALELKFGENEEFVEGLLGIDAVDCDTEEISKGLVDELLGSSTQNKCRSMQFTIYKYHLKIAEKCLESLRPFVEELRQANEEIKGSEKQFSEMIGTPLADWNKYTFPLLEEFEKTEEEMQVVENKRSMCSILLSRLSTNFVGDIKNLRLSMGNCQGRFLISVVGIYQKCLVAESNSKRLIEIFTRDNKEGGGSASGESSLGKLRTDPEYSSLVPQSVANLKTLILDLELKKNQLADEMTGFLEEQIRKLSPDKMVFQSESTEDSGEEEQQERTTRGRIFGTQSFLEALDILRQYHKESYCTVMNCIVESRSQFLELRFNNIIGHGIPTNDTKYSTILDYLSSIFEWVRVCGVAIETEFLIEALGYRVDNSCVFELKPGSLCSEGASPENCAEAISKNILNRITATLCIPFSGAIRDILRQFHPPQTSRPDSAHHFGNLTSLSTGITIGIKIAHLIDNYIEALVPMFKVLPRHIRHDSEKTAIHFPHLIQRFKDLREEAIAQYYVYTGIVRENVSSRSSDIITNDFSISLLVLEWTSLLKDILFTIQGEILSEHAQFLDQSEKQNKVIVGRDENK